MDAEGFDYFCRKLEADGYTVTRGLPAVEGVMPRAEISCEFHAGGRAIAYVMFDGTVQHVGVNQDDAGREPTPGSIAGFFNWICGVWSEAAREVAPQASGDNPVAPPVTDG